MASSPVGLRPPCVKISQRSGSPGLRDLLGVDGDDDALRAEFLGRFAHEFAARDGGRVDRDLVGARLQQLADILDRAHAAADRHRHEAALRRALDDVEDRVAVLVAGRDVEEAELVGAGRIVGGGGLDGIAGIAQADEVDALDDAAVLDVEAGNDTDFQHGGAHGRCVAKRENWDFRPYPSLSRHTRAGGCPSHEHQTRGWLLGCPPSRA